MLLAACGSAGPTDPTADRSGYLTVSATVRASATTTVTPITTTTTVTATAPKPADVPTTNSGYNVTAY